MSTGFELLGLGAIAAVIGGIVLWVVIMPGRARNKPAEKGPRKARSAERAAWDPDIDAGRRRR